MRYEARKCGMLTEAVSHAWTPALTTSSSARPVTRKGTSRSSESPPTQSVSTSGVMIAGRGAVAAVAVTGALHAVRRCARSGSPLAEEGIEVEGVGHPELDAALGGEGPLLPRAIPGELEPDPVGVGHVDRDAHAVV